MSELLKELGHDVLVANARKLWMTFQTVLSPAGPNPHRNRSDVRVLQAHPRVGVPRSRRSAPRWAVEARGARSLHLGETQVDASELGLGPACDDDLDRPQGSVTSPVARWVDRNRRGLNRPTTRDPAAGT